MEQDKISNSENKSLYDKIKEYFKVYRNNRDIVFTLYSAVWFLFCTYVVCLANSYADRTNTNVINEGDPTKEDYVAPDMILQHAQQFFDKNDWIPRNIADILVRCSAILIILRALTLKSYSLTVSRRIFLVMGFVYLLRACFIPLTVLPTPWTECIKGYHDNIFWDALLLELQLRMACGDVFFSGHTIMFTLNLLEYWYYCKNIWINIVVTLLNVVGMFTLVMSSYHYSIDVLGGFIFSTIFWCIYHWAIKIPQLGGTWWGTIINWCDDPFYYENDSLPFVYEQPLGDGRSNNSDLTDLNEQKFDTVDNIKDLEAGTQNSPISPVNEIALIYKYNKEQRKNSIKKKRDSDGIDNTDDMDLTDEEKIYKRKSVLSDSSIDNISNINLNPTLNNLDGMDEDKKEQFLSPTYGRTSSYYKHHSLNSLSSSSNSEKFSNIPTLLTKNGYPSNNNFSIATTSGVSPVSLGNSITKSISSNSLNRKISRDKSTSSRSSSSSNSRLSSNFNNPMYQGQSISPIQSLQQSFEPARDLLKDTNSYYSGSGIIKSDSRNDSHTLQANVSNINPNGVTQFKTNNIEILSVDSVHESVNKSSPKLSKLHTDISDQC